MGGRLSGKRCFVTAAGQRNPHRLYGYLAAPQMGELVRGFLQ